jgi:DNA-binding MarR family transcriptional regulator
MSRFFPWQSQNVIPKSTTFTLTQLGQSKAENFTGDERTRILMALESQGASNTEEISRYARMSKGKVERIIPSLIKGGYIQPVRGEMSD